VKSSLSQLKASVEDRSRRNGTVYHFYSGEMSVAMADPGQDPRRAPDLDPLWLMLDLTPEGRGTDWYPKLEYDHK
jgi:predicted dithiol-disulfide oxidoreductase (DUF899 family)